MLWILAGLLALVLILAAVDLFVLKRGMGLEWAGVTTYRLRLNSWLPRLLGSGGTTIGDTVHIAPGTPHCIEGLGKEPLVILCCCAPPYAHEDTELLEDNKAR